MGIVTFGLRATPFVIGKFLKRHPKVLALGRFLPPAIMGILLIDTVRSLAQQSGQAYLPELVAIAVVVVMQFVFRNALLSIVMGVGVYVLWLLNF